MKKTKLLKKLAYPVAPQLSDGFLPPANFQFKMSVSLVNKDIKIYGFAGGVWELIHDTDGEINEFISNVIHEKYYFESKTGAEQVVRVSFLSQEEEPELELDFGTSHGSRKFHHIEEVPVYRGGDQGKFLTIRTDGSLAWLGLNESYVVEVIGTGGEVSEPSSDIIASVLSHPNSTIVGNPVYENNILTLDGSSYMVHGDNSEYVHSDVMTTNVWLNADARDYYAVLGMRTGIYGIDSQAVWVTNPNGNLQWSKPKGVRDVMQDPALKGNAGWHMLTMVWDNVNGESKLYFDGQMKSTKSWTPQTNLWADVASEDIGLIIGNSSALAASGGLYGSAKYFKGSMTKLEISNEILSESQIITKFNEGYETPAEGGSEAPAENPQVFAGTFLEELPSATTNLLASSTIENGILVNAGSRMSRGTFVELDAVGIVEYNSGESTDVDFTWSGWFNPTNSGQLTNIMTMVNNSGNYRLRIAGQNWNTEGHRLDIQTNGSTSSYNSVTSEFISSSGWVHYAATYETTSTNQVFKLYINGLLFKEVSRPLGARILHPAGGKMYIGGNPALYGGETGQLDSFQIKSGVVLTADQIAAIAAQTDRQMSIETAALPAEAAVTYPIVGSLEDDTVNFSYWYTGMITEEGTFKHGSHENSMFRSVAESDDYKIMEDTTITMWVKTPYFTGEKSLIKFGDWSGSSAKGVDILFDSSTTTAKYAAGRSIMSSWTDGHLIVEVATDTHNATNDYAYRTYFKMPNIRDNEWHQIVVEFSNVGTGVGLAQGRVFVDGVKVTESFRDSNSVQQDENGYQQLSRNPGDIVGGRRWITCTGFPTNSEFDGITIEKYLLTDEQIIAKYNAGR